MKTDLRTVLKTTHKTSCVTSDKCPDLISFVSFMLEEQTLRKSTSLNLSLSPSFLYLLIYVLLLCCQLSVWVKINRLLGDQCFTASLPVESIKTTKKQKRCDATDRMRRWLDSSPWYPEVLKMSFPLVVFCPNAALPAGERILKPQRLAIRCTTDKRLHPDSHKRLRTDLFSSF